jgi:hypothetical protein
MDSLNSHENSINSRSILCIYGWILQIQNSQEKREILVIQEWFNPILHSLGKLEESIKYKGGNCGFILGFEQKKEAAFWGSLS